MDDVMNVEVVVAAAAGHPAPLLIAVEDHPPGRRRNLLTCALDVGGVHVADPLGVALRAFDRRGRHLLDGASAVLPAALALRAYRHRDAVWGSAIRRGGVHRGFFTPTWV